MKRILFVLCLLAAPAFAQEPRGPKTTTFATPATVEAPVAAGAKRNLGLIERRRLGLTVGNIAAALKELKKEGEIDATSSDSEIAAAVAVKLSEKNPQAFAAVGIDLDSIIAFIEKLLPLILKLISLFSDTSPIWTHSLVYSGANACAFALGA